MKGNPATPGGSLMSMPTWSKTKRCSITSAFFLLCAFERMILLGGGNKGNYE